MNRTNTSVAVLAMVLVAAGLCIRHTLEFREMLDTFSIAAFLTVEGIVAGTVIASGISLVRKQYVRQKKPITRRPVAAAAQA